MEPRDVLYNATDSEARYSHGCCLGLLMERDSPLVGHTYMHYHARRILFCDCLAGHILTVSAYFLIATASSSPVLPVKRFAHHEFAMTPLIPCPLDFRTRFLVTVIDVVGNLVFMNTAAPHEAFSDTTRIRSG